MLLNLVQPGQVRIACLPHHSVRISYDAEAALKAKLRTIGMLCGGFSEEELRAAGCFAIYRDPSDLLAGYAESALSQR